MGPVRQSSPQLTYEAAYTDESDITRFNQDAPNSNVMKITVVEDTVDLPPVETPSETLISHLAYLVILVISPFLRNH